jgi:hypothetical protein
MKSKESNFANIFELDSTMFTQSNNNIETSVEDVISEGDSSVTDITDITDEPSEEASEPVAQEQRDSEKKSTEPSPSISSDYDVNNLVNSLLEDDLLVFDENKEYESSEKGIKELIKETIETKTKAAVEEFKKSLPDKASELLDVLAKGGTIEDFISIEEQINYSEIPLVDKQGNDLVKNQLNLVEDWLLAQGSYTEEEIQELLEDYENTGILKKQADIARKKLHNWQETKNKEALKEKEQQLVEKSKREEQEFIDFKKEVTSTRNVAGFAITPEKANKLFDFITKKDKQGLTAFQKKDSNEARLLYAYLAMEDFDKERLVKEGVTKQILKLKKNLSNYQDSQVSPKKSDQQYSRSSSEELDKNIKWLV